MKDVGDRINRIILIFIFIVSLLGPNMARSQTICDIFDGVPIPCSNLYDDWVDPCKYLNCGGYNIGDIYVGFSTVGDIPSDVRRYFSWVSQIPLNYMPVNTFYTGSYNAANIGITSDHAYTNLISSHNIQGDPVNTFNGKPRFRVEDFSFERTGFPIKYERFYNEDYTAYNRALGQNWTSNHDIALLLDNGSSFEPANKVTLLLPDAVYRFNLSDNGSNYNSSPGCFYKLERIGGEPQNYLTQDNFFSNYTWDSFPKLDESNAFVNGIMNEHGYRPWQRYRLTDKYGNRYYFGIVGGDPDNLARIACIQDGNGNAIGYDYETYYTQIFKEIVMITKCTQFLFWCRKYNEFELRSNQALGVRLRRVYDQTGNWEIDFGYFDNPRPPEPIWTNFNVLSDLFKYTYNNGNGHRVVNVRAISMGQELENIKYDYDTIKNNAPPVAYVTRNKSKLNAIYQFADDGKNYYLTKINDNRLPIGNRVAWYVREDNALLANYIDSRKPVKQVLNARKQPIYNYQYSIANTSPLVNETVITNNDGFYQKDIYVDGVWREKHFKMDGNNYREKYEYDSNYLLTRVMDGENHSTEMNYDGLGNLTKLKDAEGNELERRYNERSRMIWEKDFNAKTRDFYYDPNGNLTEVHEPLARVTKFHYYPNGLLREIVAPSNNVTQFTYDNNGFPRSQSEPSVTVQEEVGTSQRSGANTEYLHDIRGRLTKVTDTQRRSTTYTWNDQDQLTDVYYPFEMGDSKNEHFTYTNSGLIDTSRDLNGTVTKYYYDLDGNVTEVVEGYNKPLALHTTYEYSAVGSCTGIWDPKNRKTSFLLNEQNLVRRVANLAGRSVEYEYDGAFRVRKKTDSRGVELTHDYYDNNRLKKVDASDGTESLECEYDGNGNPTVLKDSEGTKRFYYDDLGRLERVENSAHNKSLVYTYDALSRRQTMTVAGVGAYGYVFDETDNLSSITDPKNRQYRVKYDPLGDPEAAWYPNKMKATYQYYDQTKRLRSIKHLTGRNEAVASFAYNYDDAGKKTSMTDILGTHQYLYDDQDRLAEVRCPGSQGFEKYGYDDAGNVESFKKPGVDLTAQYNAANELTSGFGETFGYDGAGNMTSRTKSGQSISYNWDAFNRLVKVNTPSKSVSYVYNAFNQRVRRIDLSTNEETIYLYDGLSVIAEFDKNGNLTRSYTPGISVEEADGTVMYYHPDGNGNVAALTDAAQNIVTAYQYEAYGQREVIGHDINSYRYVGIYGVAADDDTGLVYMWNRWYDPVSKRFMSEDPLGFVDGTNLFRYAWGDAANFIDPYGLCATLPGFWEGMIPMWGSGKSAYYYTKQGQYGWATLNVGLMVTDVLLVKAVAVGAVKGIVIKSGSQSWKSVRPWLAERGFAKSGQAVHHWAIPQREWGKNVADALKNHPWNLMPAKSNLWHASIHGGGASPMGLSERLWEGTPTWTKALTASALGRELEFKASPER